MEEDGPPLLVVCLGHQQGRWATEFKLAPLRRIGEQISHKHRLLQQPQPAEAEQEMWQVHGLLIMSAWRLVKASGTAFGVQCDLGSMEPRQAMQNVLLHQCGGGGLQAAIEFPVFAASFFPDPPPFDLPYDHDIDDYSTNLDGPGFAAATWAFIQGLPQVTEVLSTEHLAPACSVSDLWKRWSARFALPWTCTGSPPLVGWRMWTPLASLVCHGHWFGDVVALHQRVSGRFGVRLRTDAPPAKLVRDYIQLKAWPLPPGEPLNTPPQKKHMQQESQDATLFPSGKASAFVCEAWLK